MFSIIMDGVTKEIHDEVKWCMMLSDDIRSFDKRKLDKVNQS